MNPEELTQMEDRQIDWLLANLIMDGDEIGPLDDWKPTQNMVQAWQVSVKIIELCGMFELYWHHTEQQWWCGYRAFSHSEADTPQRAICLAALGAYQEIANTYEP